jgi:hypothetical protein
LYRFHGYIDETGGGYEQWPGNDGANPGGLVLGRDGNFYGTTAYCGENYPDEDSGFNTSTCPTDGTVFKIGTNGGGDHFVFLWRSQCIGILELAYKTCRLAHTRP